MPNPGSSEGSIDHRFVGTVNPRSISARDPEDAELVYNALESNNPLSLRTEVQQLSHGNDTLKTQLLIDLQAPGHPRTEISDSALSSYSVHIPGCNAQYVCGIYLASKSRHCHQPYTRRDRFKYHLHGHLGFTPYPLLDNNSDKWFSSPNARDIYAKNQRSTKCRYCGSSILPKNKKRHEATVKCKTLRTSLEDPFD